MISERYDFARLKRRISIERVLEVEGLAHDLRRRGARLVGPCPLHGGDNPHAFVVTLHLGLWRCFTGCDAGGDVVELVRRLYGVDYPGAARRLAEMADSAPASLPAVPPAPRRPERTFRPFTHTLRLDPEVPYLRAKGIRPAIARRYEVGAYTGPGRFLAGCIGARLHDASGRPIGYAGRRLDSTDAAEHGKWKFPMGLPKRELLYGYHRLSSTTSDHAEVVIVECPWAVLRFAQIEVPAVALLGTTLSEYQRELLARLGARYLLMLDGDRAGRRATATIPRKLSSSGPVRVARLPDGLDPDDLTDSQLLEAARTHTS